MDNNDVLTAIIGIVAATQQYLHQTWLVGLRSQPALKPQTSNEISVIHGS